MAERARSTLVDWPRANYGYRAAEVRQIAGLLDEVIVELRAATGSSRFDLSLVSDPMPPPRVALLPPPSNRELVEQIIVVANLTDAPTERISLLKSAAAFVEDLRKIDTPATRAWVPRTRDLVARAIEAEMEIEKEYEKLARAALSAAASRAAAADVRGVERVLVEVRKGDADLGAKRPDAMAALVVAVQNKLDAARRLRLAHDDWVAKESSLRGYQRASASAVLPLQRVSSSLVDIKELAGPGPSALVRLEQAVTRATSTLGSLEPPVDLRGIHTQFMGALRFAASAVRLRRQAMASGDLKAAWDASSAAAACMMMLERAKADLTQAVKRPRL
jgi:hypothetical protein